MQSGSRLCKVIQDLVFSVKLHLSLIPYPLPIDSWLFTLDRYPSSLISDPISVPVVPYSLTPSTVPLKKIQGGGSPFFIHWRLSAIEGRLPLKVVFRRRLSSTEGHLPLKVFFHSRSSSTQGRLPLKVVFNQRSSSIEDCLPSKVVFHWRSSSIKGDLPSKFGLSWRSSSIQ